MNVIYSTLVKYIYHMWRMKFSSFLLSYLLYVCNGLFCFRLFFLREWCTVISSSVWIDRIVTLLVYRPPPPPPSHILCPTTPSGPLCYRRGAIYYVCFAVYVVGFRILFCLFCRLTVSACHSSLLTEWFTSHNHSTGITALRMVSSTHVLTVIALILVLIQVSTRSPIWFHMQCSAIDTIHLVISHQSSTHVMLMFVSIYNQNTYATNALKVPH